MRLASRVAIAKRIAKEAGVDLKLVQGSGPGGRVIKRDVEARRCANGCPAPAPRSPLPQRSGTPYEDVPLTQIRKTIAKRLAASIGPIPHFFLTTEIDMERAAEARDALNKQLGEADGKISFNDIIIKAVALALVQHVPATPGSRRITSGTGTRCTSAWPSPSRTAHHSCDPQRRHEEPAGNRAESRELRREPAVAA